MKTPPNSLARKANSMVSRATSPRTVGGSVMVTVGARVEVVSAGGAVNGLSGKAAMLVALMALEPGVERRRAAAMLWPESSEDQARNNLRTAVYRLNRSMDVELVAGSVRLSLGDAWVRVVPQEADAVLSSLSIGGARECQLLADAVDEAPVGEAFDMWLQSARQRLRQSQLRHLCDERERAEAKGDALATALARACVQLEPLNEQWYRLLMSTLARFGDRASALAVYEDLKALLRKQLGVSPDLQTRTVHLQLLQDQAAHQMRPTQTLSPAIKPPMLRRSNERYALVERDAVLKELRRALAVERHVVLRGEAGVGKTRLLRCLVEPAEGVEQVSFFASAREEPYAAITNLLQTVQPRRSARVRLQERIELARLAPLAFADVQPSEAGLVASRVHAALAQWIRALREVGLRWLVLDDLHYADSASQEAIAAVLQSTGEAEKVGAVLGPTLLLAHRTGDVGAALEEVVAKAQQNQRATCVSVPRLSMEGVQALLQQIGVDGEEAAAYLLRTGGNPLFLIELARNALEHGEESSSTTLEALLQSRLKACSVTAQQLACLAAVAAEDFTVEMSCDLLRQPPLALMPAWGELQERGLFAEHGVSHDLVRDAVSAHMPGPIAQALHRQVAVHLEQLGWKGARVLSHWVAGHDYDRALPHAVHQLHQASKLNASTAQIELDLLGLMEKLTDATLLTHLWLSAEISGGTRMWYLPAETWRRMAGLVERVSKLRSDASTKVWMAFETSRVLFNRDRAARDAYDLLSTVAVSLPPEGIERARVELWLATYR